ncbi:MAG: cobalt ECF transporter T component CbiQ [Dorea sp.]|nr:cobalt ECF transporter T component CbiQ [Dorea sp.]
MIIIDKLCYQSRLRYANAAEKFTFATLTLIICIVSRSFTISALVLIIMGILTVKVGGVPGACYVRAMLVPAAFLILSTLAVMVNLSKTPLDAFALPAGSYYITSSISGILAGLRLMLTALSSVSCLYFLSMNTPVTDILEVMKRLHVPRILLELMLLTYRFIFLMLSLSSAITTAQNSRLGNKDLKTSRTSFSRMLSSVLILSLKHSNALYDAMESRCYAGVIRTLPLHHPARRSEILAIAGCDFFLIAISIYIKLWR